MDSVISSLVKYFDDLTLNEVLVLRTVSKNFEMWVNSILSNYVLNIRTMSQFEQANDLVTYFTKCHIHGDRLGTTLTYKEFGEKVGDKFNKGNIKEFSFNMIHQFKTASHFKHFANATKYIFNNMINMPDGAFKYLQGAKKYTIFICPKLTPKIAKFIKGAKFYCINGVKFNIKDIAEHIKGANKYIFPRKYMAQDMSCFGEGANIKYSDYILSCMM